MFRIFSNLKYKYLLSIFALLAIHLFLLVNIQFTSWPEMFSFPYLFLNGFSIYRDYVHPYPPLLTLVLAAVFKIFGLKILVLKLFTWFLILINDLLIYKIVTKFAFDKKIGLLTLLLYVLIQPFLDGNMLWFDTALVTPILASTLFAIKYFDDNLESVKNLTMSGFFLGLSLLIKQTVFAYIAVFVFLIVFLQKKIKNTIYLLAPIVGTACILFVYLVANNSLIDFLNWNFIYPSSVWTKFPGYVMLALGRSDTLKLLLVLLPSLLLPVFYKKIWKDFKGLYLYLFLVAGIASIYPRFSFFHFQTALVFAILIFGYFVSKTKIGFTYIAIYFLIIAKFLIAPNFDLNWHKETRFWSNSEVGFAKIIFGKTSANNIYLLGLNSVYYVLTEKLPPKPWLDNFGWFFEVPGVQEKTLESWGKNPPSAIFVQNPESGNWFDIGTYMPKEILTWIETNYTRKEEVTPGVWYWELNK